MLTAVDLELKLLLHREDEEEPQYDVIIVENLATLQEVVPSETKKHPVPKQKSNNSSQVTLVPNKRME